MFYKDIKPFIFNDREIKYINHYIPYVKSIIIMTNPLYKDISYNKKLTKVFDLLFPTEDPNPFLLQAFFNYLYPYSIDSTSKKSNQLIYDFKYDEELIYSAFLQTYNIDLSKPNKNLTIQKFIALFNSLPESTKFSHILGIRTQEIPKPSKGNNDYRNSIIKQKQSVALYKSYNLNNKKINPIANFVMKFKKY